MCKRRRWTPSKFDSRLFLSSSGRAADARDPRRHDDRQYVFIYFSRRLGCACTQLCYTPTTRTRFSSLSFSLAFRIPEVQRRGGRSKSMTRGRKSYEITKRISINQCFGTGYNYFCYKVIVVGGGGDGRFLYPSSFPGVVALFSTRHPREHRPVRSPAWITAVFMFSEIRVFAVYMYCCVMTV